MRLQNAGRVSNLNGGRNLSIKSRTGSSKPRPFADSSSNLVQESASAWAKSAESLEAHCAKVDSVSNERVLPRLLFFGNLGGPRGVAAVAKMYVGAHM